MASETLSSIFFPLRTNADYFDNPTQYLQLSNRIKQSAILYDVALFEGGAYTATVWPENSLDALIPAQAVNTSQLRKQRNEFSPRGGNAELKMQFSEKEEPFLISGPVVRRYISEFHTLLLDLGCPDLSWAQMVTIDLVGDGQETLEKFNGELRQAMSTNFSTGGYFLDSLVVKNLSRDLLVASDANQPISMHPFYSQLLTSEGFSGREAPGIASLEVIVPNFSSLSWDTILEIRESQSGKEFRKRVLEVEKLARDNLSGNNIKDVQFEVLKQVTGDLLDELSQSRPTVSQGIANVAIDLMTGFVPGPLGGAITATREGLALSKYDKSWVAAFLRLTNKEWN